LLDTVRVVLVGGMKAARQKRRYPSTITGPLESEPTGELVKEAVA
jgi:hypothetical protein